jgi:hypothetical protein
LVESHVAANQAAMLVKDALQTPQVICANHPMTTMVGVAATMGAVQVAGVAVVIVSRHPQCDHLFEVSSIAISSMAEV